MNDFSIQNVQNSVQKNTQTMMMVNRQAQKCRQQW